MPEHVPEHTGKDGKQPAVGKVQGRWMNPPSRSAEPGKPILLSMYDDEDFTTKELPLDYIFPSSEMVISPPTIPSPTTKCRAS